MQNILVVTYTKAATQELKTRILNQLNETLDILFEVKINPNFMTDDVFFNEFLSLRHDLLDKDIAILSQSIQIFDQAAIFTIHGFCSLVLRDYQLEFGINYPFEQIVNKKEIFEKLIRDYFYSNIINNPILAKNLVQVYRTLDEILPKEYTLDYVRRIALKIPDDILEFREDKYLLKYEIIANYSLAILLDNTATKIDILANLLSSVASYLAIAYNKYIQINNQLSYEDIINIVSNKVENNELIAKKLSYNYPVAFIDEFQDTDELQYKIFKSIYLTHGTLIVVGDPKQAIYSFRGADINVYIKARDFIKNTLVLQENRRSHPNILNFINELFLAKNNPNCFGKNLNYIPSVAKAKITMKLPSAQEIEEKLSIKTYDENVQIVYIKGQNETVKNTNLLDNIALEILTILNINPTLANKIAILVTNNYQAKQVVMHLAQYNIRAIEYRLASIYSTSTAIELYKILQAVIYFPEQKLLNIALSTTIFNLPLCSLDEHLGLMQQKFYGYKDILLNSGIMSLIYSLISDFSHNLTYRELANLIQLGELLNNKINSVYELIYWYKNKLENPDEDNDEELIRLDNSEDQVTVTTQHSAKGLEYDVLFCPYFFKEKKIATLPFFAIYHSKGQIVKKLITKNEDAQTVLNEENEEIHRLNYVALTRAKARLYIYQKAIALNKSGAYSNKTKPTKIAELFGFNVNNHPLFDYSQFSTLPTKVIKQDLRGIAIYNSGSIEQNILNKLKISAITMMHNSWQKYQPINYKIKKQTIRQSYSSITHKEANSLLEPKFADYYEIKEVDPIIKLQYQYKVLNELSGAKFGILIHTLLEKYPITAKEIKDILRRSNIDTSYTSDIEQVINQTFNYPLIFNTSLSKISKVQNELEFNLSIKNTVSLTKKIANLLAKHYGKNHPYAKACATLENINQGFLSGYIDVFFAIENKYFILDYKSNLLVNYPTVVDIFSEDNVLVKENARNHYYLQYLIYLVAIKRYLESRLDIADATELLGGAVYYYIRGIFVLDNLPGGVYIDTTCNNLVAEIDLLLKE